MSKCEQCNQDYENCKVECLKPQPIAVSNPSVQVTQPINPNTNNPIGGVMPGAGTQSPKTNGDKIRASSDEQLATAYADAIKCDQCLIVYDCMEIRRSKKCICKLIAWLQSPAEVQP